MKRVNKMADLSKIVEDLSSLTVLEAAELSKMLEEKWGVSAAAPVAAPGPGGPPDARRRRGRSAASTPALAGARGVAEVAEEHTEFSVVLTGGGDKKINVIKEVRSVRPDLGLKEA